MFFASQPKAKIKELRVQLKSVKKIGKYCDSDWGADVDAEGHPHAIVFPRP